jgi:protein gp37
VTGIEWTDATWNPVTGCDRVSEGCDHCYALTMAKRLKAMGSSRYQRDGDPRTSGPGFGLTEHPDVLDLPNTWRTPRRVFVNSMSDLFHPKVSHEFIADVWSVMAQCPQHTFQILTKRPQRMAGLLAPAGAVTRVLGDREPAFLTVPTLDGTGSSDLFRLPNVWLGTSIESDLYAWRADHLRRTPAAVRFLSLEPLLGPVSSLDLTGIDWVIVGGESGTGARPCDIRWIADIIQRCRKAGVAVFVKQLGARSGIVGQEGALHVSPRRPTGDRKGGDMSWWPEDLKVREYPKVSA